VLVVGGVLQRVRQRVPWQGDLLSRNHLRGTGRATLLGGRAAILANATNVRLRDLPPEVTQKSRRRPALDTLDLQEQERTSIERGLDRFGGDRRKAAEALNISTVTLWRKMKQFGLSS
jgi:transcriptional regulator of acetoin/glycerol metabolism